MQLEGIVVVGISSVWVSSGSKIEMGGPKCKCLVMALRLGPGEAKVFLGTYSHTKKVQNWGSEGHGPLDLLLCVQHFWPHR